MNFGTCVGAAVGWLLVIAAQAGAVGVTNGDFSAGLSGWSAFGPVSDGGGFALLEEDPVRGVTSLEQQIVIPAGARFLSIRYGISSTPDGTSGFPFFDGFVASLLDPATFDPILSSAGFTDFFFEDRAGLRQFDPSIVGVSGNILTLNLTSVPPGTDALIAFDLLGGDDGFATQATVDDVQVHARVGVVPEPLTLFGLPMGVAAVVVYLRRRNSTRAA